jgi:hypothetical protein
MMGWEAALRFSWRKILMFLRDNLRILDEILRYAIGGVPSIGF